jgi:hypothetical protein
MAGVGRPKGLPKTGGRQKGDKNAVSKQLKDMILGALSDAGGQDYLLQQARDNPGPFLTLIGKVLPTTLATDPDSPIIARIESVIVSPKNTDSSHIRTSVEAE